MYDEQPTTDATTDGPQEIIQEQPTQEQQLEEVKVHCEEDLRKKKLDPQVIVEEDKPVITNIEIPSTLTNPVKKKRKKKIPKPDNNLTQTSQQLASVIAQPPLPSGSSDKRSEKKGDRRSGSQQPVQPSQQDVRLRILNDSPGLKGRRVELIRQNSDRVRLGVEDLSQVAQEGQLDQIRRTERQKETIKLSGPEIKKQASSGETPSLPKPLERNGSQGEKSIMKIEFRQISQNEETMTQRNQEQELPQSTSQHLSQGQLSKHQTERQEKDWSEKQEAQPEFTLGPSQQNEKSSQQLSVQQSEAATTEHARLNSVNIIEGKTQFIEIESEEEMLRLLPVDAFYAIISRVSKYHFEEYKAPKKKKHRILQQQENGQKLKQYEFQRSDNDLGALPVKQDSNALQTPIKDEQIVLSDSVNTHVLENSQSQPEEIQPRKLNRLRIQTQDSDDSSPFALAQPMILDEGQDFKMQNQEGPQKQVTFMEQSETPLPIFSEDLASEYIDWSKPQANQKSNFIGSTDLVVDRLIEFKDLDLKAATLPLQILCILRRNFNHNVDCTCSNCKKNVYEKIGAETFGELNSLIQTHSWSKNLLFYRKIIDMDQSEEGLEDSAEKLKEFSIVQILYELNGGDLLEFSEFISLEEQERIDMFQEKLKQLSAKSLFRAQPLSNPADKNRKGQTKKQKKARKQLQLKIEKIKSIKMETASPGITSAVVKKQSQFSANLNKVINKKRKNSTIIRPISMLEPRRQSNLGALKQQNPVLQQKRRFSVVQASFSGPKLNHPMDSNQNLSPLILPRQQFKIGQKEVSRVFEEEQNIPLKEENRLIESKTFTYGTRNEYSPDKPQSQEQKPHGTFGSYSIKTASPSNLASMLVHPFESREIKASDNSVESLKKSQFETQQPKQQEAQQTAGHRISLSGISSAESEISEEGQEGDQCPKKQLLNEEDSYGEEDYDDEEFIESTRERLIQDIVAGQISRRDQPQLSAVLMDHESRDETEDDIDKKLSILWQDYQCSTKDFTILKGGQLDSSEKDFLSKINQKDNLHLQWKLKQQDGLTIAQIMKDAHVSREEIYLCVQRRHFVNLRTLEYLGLKNSQLSNMYDQLSRHSYMVSLSQGIGSKQELLIINKQDPQVANRIDLASQTCCPYVKKQGQAKKKSNSNNQTFPAGFLQLFQFNLIPQKVLNQDIIKKPEALRQFGNHRKSIDTTYQCGDRDLKGLVMLHKMASQLSQIKKSQLIEEDKYICHQSKGESLQSWCPNRTTRFKMLLQFLNQPFLEFLRNKKLMNFKYYSSHVLSQTKKTQKQDIQSYDVKLPNVRYSMVHNFALDMTIQRLLIHHGSNQLHLKNILFDSEGNQIRYKLKKTYPEELMFQRCLNLTKLALCSKGIPIDDVILKESCDFDLSNVSISSDENKIDLHSSFQGAWAVESNFKSPSKKSPNKKSLSGLSQPSTPDPETIKMDFNIFRVIYHDQEVGKKQALFMSEKADLISESSNVNVSKDREEPVSDHSWESEEEAHNKFQLTRQFGYGQYTLRSGLYDIFQTELFYRTIHKNEQDKKKKKKLMELKVRGNIRSAEKPQLQKKESLVPQKKIKVISEYNYKKDDNGVVIAVPRKLNETNEDLLAGAAAQSILELNFLKILDNKSSEGGNSSKTPENGRSMNLFKFPTLSIDKANSIDLLPFDKNSRRSFSSVADKEIKVDILNSGRSGVSLTCSENSDKQFDDDDFGTPEMNHSLKLPKAELVRGFGQLNAIIEVESCSSSNKEQYVNLRKMTYDSHTQMAQYTHLISQSSNSEIDSVKEGIETLTLEKRLGSVINMRPDFQDLSLQQKIQFQKRKSILSFSGDSFVQLKADDSESESSNIQKLRPKAAIHMSNQKQKKRIEEEIKQAKNAVEVQSDGENESKPEVFQSMLRTGSKHKDKVFTRTVLWNLQNRNSFQRKKKSVLKQNPWVRFKSNTSKYLLYSRLPRNCYSLDHLSSKIKRFNVACSHAEEYSNYGSDLSDMFDEVGFEKLLSPRELNSAMLLSKMASIEATDRKIQSALLPLTGFEEKQNEEQRKQQRQNMERLKKQLEKKKILNEMIQKQPIKFFLNDQERREKAEMTNKKLNKCKSSSLKLNLLKNLTGGRQQMDPKEEMIAKKGLPLTNLVESMKEKLSNTIIRRHERQQEYLKVKRAIENNQPSVIADFVQFNVQMINMQDKDGYTLLALAVHYGRVGMVESLLKNGADPNKATHITKDTPLHLAVSLKLKKIQDLLIESGADEHAVNAAGKVPWEGQ